MEEEMDICKCHILYMAKRKKDLLKTAGLMHRWTHRDCGSVDRGYIELCPDEIIELRKRHKS